jgi:sterol 24-C-methyltransferase
LRNPCHASSSSAAACLSVCALSTTHPQQQHTHSPTHTHTHTAGGDAAVKGVADANVGDAIAEYDEFYNEKAASRKGHSDEHIKKRKRNYAKVVNHYYDLATDFYEYGWGQSFHFAPRFAGEDFQASLARHEHYLASRMNLVPGQKVADLGCGVGGPMRAIARFSGANVVGVNNNAYQVQRVAQLNEAQGLDGLCDVVKGNFMELPFKEATFDAAYGIEALCHAPSFVDVYKEVYRTLKPGGMFASYEWVMTPNYDPTNAAHNFAKHQIEHGDGLHDMVGQEDVKKAIVEAGFELIEAADLVQTMKATNSVPWYSTFLGGLKLSQLKHSQFGRWCTQALVDVMETCKLAPSGTSSTHKMLIEAAEGLTAGGELEIFTPMYFVLARKPLDAKPTGDHGKHFTKEGKAKKTAAPAAAPKAKKTKNSAKQQPRKKQRRK